MVAWEGPGQLAPAVHRHVVTSGIRQDCMRIGCAPPEGKGPLHEQGSCPRCLGVHYRGEHFRTGAISVEDGLTPMDWRERHGAPCMHASSKLLGDHRALREPLADGAPGEVVPRLCQVLEIGFHGAGQLQEARNVLSGGVPGKPGRSGRHSSSGDVPGRVRPVVVTVPIWRRRAQD